MEKKLSMAALESIHNGMRLIRSLLFMFSSFHRRCACRFSGCYRFLFFGLGTYKVMLKCFCHGCLCCIQHRLWEQSKDNNEYGHGHHDQFFAYCQVAERMVTYFLSEEDFLHD